MKVNIKGISYTLIAVVPETVEVKGLMGNKEVTKAVVYVYDKNREVHKFLAEEMKRVD